MKKIFLLTGLLITSLFLHSQILKKITDKGKEKVGKKTEKTVDDATNGKKDEKKTVESKDTTTTPAGNTTQPASLKTYSKFDFVPGEKVIGFEDFSTGNIGDFPAGWNTNASGEIVTIENVPGRWLKITRPGGFSPEFTDKYPEDFTFEFDVLHSYEQGGNPQYLFISIAELQNVNEPQNFVVANNSYAIILLPGQTNEDDGACESTIRQNGATGSGNTTRTAQLGNKNHLVHISIWRQKERVRVYMNEEKVWDIPKALTKGIQFNSLVFFQKDIDENFIYYLSNLRLAVGAPDTRKKMLEQNKWVTHGILFDVNSDKIKPESYGTLKEMANVLKEYPDLKVKIVGHTDADGKDADNLDLSKRRSASVKTALSKEFAIDAGRMETDGKGEGEPIDKNDSPAGKANNRRVEFIKL
jgi:outer membrane protein OmpA-like peptidoglycan-associated protein